jgi:hypothetical protein
MGQYEECRQCDTYCGDKRIFESDVRSKTRKRISF